MERSLITLAEYYRYHSGIEPDFVHALASGGLITITVIEQEPAIAYEELPALERYLRLHYDLDINLEGVEAIGHLLGRVDLLQEELRTLRARLSFYGEAGAGATDPE